MNVMLRRVTTIPTLFLTLLMSLSCGKSPDQSSTSATVSDIAISGEPSAPGGRPDIPATNPGESPLGNVRLEYFGSIGSDEADGFVFSMIKGVVVDSMDNVFVLDAHMMDVRGFSPIGELIFRKELVKGEGPGELIGPVNLALSGDERFFYIFDQDRRMISVYTKEMDFVHSFVAQTNYAYMTDGPESSVLASFNQMDIRDRPLLRFFDERGRQIGAFGGKQAMYDELRAMNLQLFYLTYIVRQDKKTYLSYGYPYDIHVFDEDNVLLQRIERQPDFFGRTYTKGEFTHPTGVIVSLVGARNSLLLHFLVDRENEITYAEALDDMGRSRGTVKLGDQKDDWGYYLYSFPDAVTSDDFVYIVAQTPFPRLVSFKIIRE